VAAVTSRIPAAINDLRWRAEKSTIRTITEVNISGCGFPLVRKFYMALIGSEVGTRSRRQVAAQGEVIRPSCPPLDASFFSQSSSAAKNATAAPIPML
jgi:hypothetical protein